MLIGLAGALLYLDKLTLELSNAALHPGNVGSVLLGFLGGLLSLLQLRLEIRNAALHFCSPLGMPF